MLKLTNRNIRLAKKIINKNGVIVYPTDTVYGLGCNPFTQDAVEKMFNIKRRGDKPLPILISSQDHLFEISTVNEKALKLIERYWPGKLTIILRSRKKIPCAPRRDTIAVRIPGRQDTLRLIEACGGYLVGTSANLSGGPVSKTVFDALSQLGADVDLYLDGGATSGIPSTVVDASRLEIKILREGIIKAEDIYSSTDKL